MAAKLVLYWGKAVGFQSIKLIGSPMVGCSTSLPVKNAQGME